MVKTLSTTEEDEDSTSLNKALKMVKSLSQIAEEDDDSSSSEGLSSFENLSTTVLAQRTTVRLLMLVGFYICRTSINVRRFLIKVWPCCNEFNMTRRSDQYLNIFNKGRPPWQLIQSSPLLQCRAQLCC